MSNKKRVPIATIKLAPGEAGYYDEYSRIYLSSSRPDAVIYSGTNCTQIKRSIKSGRLRLVSGGFDKPVVQEEILKEEAPVAQEVVEEPKAEAKTIEEDKKESASIENIVTVESEQVEEKVEVQEEQPVEEVVVAKKSRRRSRKQEEVVETTFEEVPVVEENV